MNFLCNTCEYENFFFDRAYTCAYYEGAVKKLIHSFKFERRRDLSAHLTDFLHDFYVTHLGGEAFDAVAAVPLDKSRIRERGFNQSELLAKDLAKRLRLPNVSPCLGRNISPVPQATLKKRERKKNVEGVFYCHRPLPAGTARVLLVDDLLTTGHTASECAKALKLNGAKNVTALAVARGFWV